MAAADSSKTTKVVWISSTFGAKAGDVQEIDAAVAKELIANGHVRKTD